MTMMKTHFDTNGIPGVTYPAESPQELRAETMSKTRLVTSREIRWNWSTTIVAMNTVSTDRMITSMFLDNSGSATLSGTLTPPYMKGTRTFVRTKTRLNHQSIPRYPIAMRESLTPPALLSEEPPMNIRSIRNTMVTLGNNWICWP